MLRRTDHPHAPWHVIAAENKHYARVAVVETVNAALEQGLRAAGIEPTTLAERAPEAAGQRRHAANVGRPPCASSASSHRPPRCCSRSASATDLVAVTHECDYPQDARSCPRSPATGCPAASARPRSTRPSRSGRWPANRSTSSTPTRCTSCEPDLIVTQALCSVCAVSYDDVRSIADEIESPAKGDLAGPAHGRRGAGRRSHAGAGHRYQGRGGRADLPRAQSGSTASASRRAARDGPAWSPSSGSTRRSPPATGPRS